MKTNRSSKTKKQRMSEEEIQQAIIKELYFDYIFYGNAIMKITDNKNIQVIPGFYMKGVLQNENRQH